MAGLLTETQGLEVVYSSLENLSMDSESSRQEQFDVFLVQAIDEALTSLGEPVKNALYQRLEVDFNIHKNDIPKKIGEFSDIIHKIFGLGACRLERKFMKNLNSKVQASVRLAECEGSLSEWIIMETSFDEYVAKVRKNYEALCH